MNHFIIAISFLIHKNGNIIYRMINMKWIYNFMWIGESSRFSTNTAGKHAFEQAMDTIILWERHIPKIGTLFKKNKNECIFQYIKELKIGVLKEE